MNPGDALARTLVEALAASGVRFACLAPGSRSAPLALALARHPEIRLHVTLDERSAAFVALGTGRVTGAPAIVLTTSGTAAANVFPAIQEAHHGRVPLIVLTADRPPELRHTGANQTIDQIKMFGDAVRWFAEVGVATRDDRPYWRSLGARAIARATGSPPGPVHLNVAFREPLVPADDPGDPSGEGSSVAIVPGRRTLPRPELEDLAAELSAVERGAVVAGPAPGGCDGAARLAEVLRWPLLADPLSGERRGRNAITTYDALLRHEAFATEHRPTLVLRAGALGISKSLIPWVSSAERHLLVDRDGWPIDPEMSLDRIYVCDPSALLPSLAELVTPRSDDTWLKGWLRADAAARETIEATLTSSGVSEPRSVRDLVAALPSGANLFVGASMPFRHVEWFTAPRDDVRYFGNRGTNGIDGSVGTAIGVALASEAPTYALLGDLTLLHDQNALLMRPPDVDLTLVVLNNDGGGIFSFLPQARLPEFEHLFGTPHGRDLKRLAAFHGCDHFRVSDPEEVAALVREPDGVRIVEVTTDRSETVELLRRIEEEVGATLAR